MKSLKVITLIVIVAICCGDVAVASHPFHVSRAEIEYNAKRQTFEVALCVWPEDLERAVSKMEKHKINIDDESEISRDKLFCKYVASKFKFIPNDADQNLKAASIRWVGSEIEVKQGWLYFEVDASSGSQNWTIGNRIFFELNDDQMNHLQLREGKQLISQTLSAQQSSGDWSLKK